jgi:carboxypeptidase C (cathepsin A)
MNFLHNLYTEFPSLKNCPLYITGESFAGHYIPNLARKILTNDTFVKKTGARLTGISIGDGWTDPINQINYYDSYLWSVGVVERKFRDVCTWFQTNAIINIYDGNYQKATNFFDFITNNDTTPEVYMGNISIFNFRNYDGLDESFATFLNKNKAEFGATVDYIPGNDAIYTAFGNDISRSYAADVVVALRNIKVLIYNGQNDLVVNTPGVLQYINSLNWEGTGQWKRTAKQIWTRYGEVKGWAKVAGNLWFVMVNGAGHMVPTDQPEAAFTMLGHFISNEHDWKQ